MLKTRGREGRRRPRLWLLAASLTLSTVPCSAADEAKGLETMSLEEILNMTVSVVSRSDEKLAEAPGVITVLSKDELERFGGLTLKDLLQRVPGLAPSAVYMTDRSTIAARGDQIQPSSSHVLLLINGRPVREALEGGIKSEVFETLPAGMIQQIEVIRGPGSVLYGSNAFSAVINVITETVERTGAAVTALAGPSGERSGTLDATLKKGELSVVATGRLRQKGEWAPRYDYPGPDGATIGQEMSIPDKGAAAFVDVSYKRFRLTSAFNQWENAYFIPDYAFFGHARWTKEFANLGYSARPSAHWNMDLNVTWTRSRFKTSAAPNSDRNSYDFVTEWTNSVKTSSRSRLLFGGLYQLIDGSEGIFGGVLTRRHAGGLYAQLDYKLRDGITAIGGVQLNKIQDRDPAAVPRLGLVWRPLSRLYVKALYSEAYRAPGINELSLQHPAMLGNPDLKPERVGSADLNVSYQGERVQLAAGYFRTRQKDVIFQDRSGPVPVYNNMGEAEIKGVEVEGKLYFGNGFYLTGSAIHFEAEDGNGSKPVTPVASFGAKGGLSYVWSRGLTVGVFSLYQGELSKEFDTALNPSPGAYNLTSLNVRADLRRLVGLEAPLALVGQVDNLLGDEIWLPLWGLRLGTSMPWIEGRSVFVGLELSL